MRCVFVLTAASWRRRRTSAGGALLVNIVLLREYVCMFKEIYVCVVFVC